jgi:hypothetical protein
MAQEVKARKFWEDPIGQKFNHQVHELNAGSSRVSWAVKRIRKLTKDEKILEELSTIESGLKIINDGCDYTYNQIKKLRGFE